MSQIESFNTTPLQSVIPSYLYFEYSDDDDLQAFVASQNALAQGYLDWFNQTPLAVYTGAGISGPLLDWIGQGIYGIARPVLASQTISKIAGYDSAAYNTMPYNTLFYTQSGMASIATDDIYKRVMTWDMYRGDGQPFTMGWLKNRISRFLNGANGSDFAVLNDQPSITVTGSVFTVTAFASDIYTAMQLCYLNNSLSFPFQYSMAFVGVNFTNAGGALRLATALNYPTSAAGLSPGNIWSNAGAVSVVSGITPDPTAAPVYFNSTNPRNLLALGGGNLPLSNPGAGTGQLWNNAGAISVA